MCIKIPPHLTGAIVIKNWKPLPLDKITDNTLISVSEILGELTSNVTLKITIIRTKPTQLAEIKDKLLKLLILQSHTVLRSSGCPLDEVSKAKQTIIIATRWRTNGMKIFFHENFHKSHTIFPSLPPLLSEREEWKIQNERMAIVERRRLKNFRCKKCKISSPHA